MILLQPKNWLRAVGPRAVWARIRGGASPRKFLPVALALAVMPAVALATYGQIYWQLGFVDPLVYTGLVRNYGDIVERIGPTYFAARIAHIFPAAFFNSAFGDIGGFYAFRYALLASASLAAFFFAMRAYSAKVGLVAAAYVTFSPILLTAMSSDMYGGTAAIYLLLAYAAALTPTHRPILGHLAAGAFLALSAQTVQLSIAVFATIAPSWFLLHRGLSVSKKAALIFAGGAGFVATYALLLFLLGLTSPRWSEGDPTFAMIRQLLGGGMRQWDGSLAELVAHEMYYPVALAMIGVYLATALLVRGAGAEASKVRIIAYSLLPILPFLFYLWRDTQGHGVLHWEHTNVLLFPSSVFAASALVGEFVGGAPSELRNRLYAAFIIGFAACWSLVTPGLVRFLDQMGHSTLVAASILLCGALSVAAWLGRRSLAATMAVLVSIFVVIAPYQFRDFFLVRGGAIGEEPYGWDLRRGADRLIDFVSTASPPKDAVVGFWYRSANRGLSAVQSAYAWLYTRIMPADAEGMPEIDGVTAEWIDRFDRIVLLAGSAAEADAGLKSLAEFLARNGRSYEKIAEDRFEGERWGYNATMVELLQPPAPPKIADDKAIGWVDLARMKSFDAWAPARVDHVDGKVQVTGYPSHGGFSAMLELGDAFKVEGPAVARIWVSAPHGAFMVLAVDPQDTSRVYSGPIPIKRSKTETLVEVPLDDMSVPVALIFANASGIQGIAIVSAIEVSKR